MDLRQSTQSECCVTCRGKFHGSQWRIKLGRNARLERNMIVIGTARAPRHKASSVNCMWTCPSPLFWEFLEPHRCPKLRDLCLMSTRSIHDDEIELIELNARAFQSNNIVVALIATLVDSNAIKAEESGQSFSKSPICREHPWKCHVAPLSGHSELSVGNVGQR